MLGSAVTVNPETPVINGDFLIWQRGTSFTADGSAADRWRQDKGTSAGAPTDTQMKGRRFRPLLVSPFNGAKGTPMREKRDPLALVTIVVCIALIGALIIGVWVGWL